MTKFLIDVYTRLIWSQKDWGDRLLKKFHTFVIFAIIFKVIKYPISVRYHDHIWLASRRHLSNMDVIWRTCHMIFVFFFIIMNISVMKNWWTGHCIWDPRIFFNVFWKPAIKIIIIISLAVVIPTPAASGVNWPLPCPVLIYYITLTEVYDLDEQYPTCFFGCQPKCFRRTSTDHPVHY